MLKSRVHNCIFLLPIDGRYRVHTWIKDTEEAIMRIDPTSPIVKRVNHAAPGEW
jgi:hypothetical protein